MRLEGAGPRTWLLAALAGWAVLALLLAVAGMGGRVEPLAEGEGMAEPLPSTPPDGELGLGPLPQYSVIGERPLFSTDRKPKPFSLQGDNPEQPVDSAFDYQLTSVLLTPGLRMAILQPADGSESVRVKLEEAPASHPAWRLVELGPRSAVFEGPEGRRTMALRVFDGQGGQAPTAVSRRDAEAAARPAIRMPAVEPADPVPAVADADAAAPAGAREAEAKPATPESQMEAIRQRIQARRAALREQAQERQDPQRQPQPPAPPSPNPPAESQ